MRGGGRDRGVSYPVLERSVHRIESNRVFVIFILVRIAALPRVSPASELVTYRIGIYQWRS